MLNIYKTQYKVKDTDMNKTHSDTISVFACSIAEALEKTKAKINPSHAPRDKVNNKKKNNKIKFKPANNLHNLFLK